MRCSVLLLVETVLPSSDHEKSRHCFLYFITDLARVSHLEDHNSKRKRTSLALIASQTAVASASNTSWATKTGNMRLNMTRGACSRVEGSSVKLCVFD